jgi:uncharacterized membrane protein
VTSVLACSKTLEPARTGCVRGPATGAPGKHQPHDQSKHEPRRSHERTTAPHAHQPGPAAARRATPQELENRIADQITRFAGSMQFVYLLHVIWFAAWIILGVEHYPYGLLTMIVSLEAIFCRPSS